jgi:streptogramin lyase
MNGNRLSDERIDRELGAWLRTESAMRAPVGLVEGVFAHTSRTRQARRWWPPQPALMVDLAWRVARLQPPAPHVINGQRKPAWQRVRALTGAVAVLLVVVVLAIGTGRQSTGPGATASAIPSPAVSPGQSPSPSASGSPGPEATTVGSFPAHRLALGTDAAPIHVTEAFGSIWVADIHANDVRRFDPTTMAEVARISVPSAAWFAATDDALWVTSQNGVGINRIDPGTNSVVAHVGDVPPCGAPVVAFDSLWQAACDGNVILRIDPATNAVVDTIPLQGHRFLVLAANRLITVGPEGLAALDPATGEFTTIGGGRSASETEFLFSDGDTVWVNNTLGVTRLDPADGSAIAGFSEAAGQAVSFAGDHAWLTVSNLGVLEIDLSTNQVRRTIPLQRPSLLLSLEANGALWVTDFDGSALWRIDL